MPSYQLMFDHRGEPRLEEEFSGERPDEAGFRAAIGAIKPRGWSELVAEMTGGDGPGEIASTEEWGLLPGACDPECLSANDSRRPAPFGFE